MPELATKSAQLLDELEKLRSKSKIDAFTLRRLEHEAKKLLAVDALSGYQILGALCGLSGRVAEMRENYDRALQLALTPAEKAMVFNNYAISLLNTGYFAESVELANQVLSLINANIPVPIFVESSYKSGLVHQAAQRTDIISHFNQELLQHVVTIVQFMDKHEVQDTELQKMIEIAASVLHEHHFFDFRNISIGFSSDEESTWFRYVIQVARSVEEVVEMKYELAAQLAEVDLPMNLLSNFLVTYQCVGDENESD